MTFILYSGLFSLSANFLEFHKWAHYSGKFILDCYMKFEVQLWVAIAEIGMDAMMHDVQMASLSTLKPKAMGCKVFQSTVVAKVTLVAGCGYLYYK